MKKMLLIPFAAMMLCTVASCSGSNTFEAYGREIYSYVDFNLDYSIEPGSHVQGVTIYVTPAAKQGYHLDWLECALYIDVYCYGTKKEVAQSDKRNLEFYYFKSTAGASKKETTISEIWDEITNVVVTVDDIASKQGMGCVAQITKY